jgi:hypothetical protein
MFPNTIISAVYLVQFYLLGWVRYEKTTGWAIVLKAVEGKRLAMVSMRGWTGWASGVFIVMRYDCIDSHTTLVHEERHVKQQMVFGIFQPITYFLISVFIWLFLRTKHSYYDNPYERDARRAAGQRVDIPKSFWRNPNDRWSWW